MNWGLQNSVILNGVEYSIRSDYRAVLDIIAALNDPELTASDKGEVALQIFYPDWETIPVKYRQEAVDECMKFISHGSDDTAEKVKLLDWEKDFNIIVAPVNRVLGYEVRESNCHWHTFLSGYMEIGDCFFAQVVNIRNKKAHHKPLEKAEAEFYKKNRKLIDFDMKLSETETDLINEWTKG